MTTLLTGLLVFGCSPEFKYERELKRELASGVKHDTLFMGIYLGMPQKDFYTLCWKLNMDGVIRQGSTNTTVEYTEREALKAPATLNFYPDFYEDKIVELPVRFKYNGWAPWNKSLSSDSLQLDVLKWYEKEYGGSFISVAHSKWGTAYVNIKGNRRISIFKEDDMHVRAVFKDMLVETPPEPEK
jgi:hypothetical protein